ncbi:unnamed protein product, partial [Iphiclides podalirius]
MVRILRSTGVLCVVKKRCKRCRRLQKEGQKVFHETKATRPRKTKTKQSPTARVEKSHGPSMPYCDHTRNGNNAKRAHKRRRGDPSEKARHGQR